MSEVDDDLSQLCALAESYLIACRQGATVAQMLPHVRTLLAGAGESMQSMRETSPHEVVEFDRGLNEPLRSYLEKRFEARRRAAIQDHPSSTMRPRLTRGQVVKLETEAIYDLADHSRSQFTAFVTSRHDIGEQLDAEVTENEWSSLIRALRNNPAVLADFAASIIRNHRAFIASRQARSSG